MENAKTYTVGEVANAAHLTIRTLHHYDALGVLRPSFRSDAGYRRYTHADLERLQQILLYRELGFSLGQIREAMDDPGFDRRKALLVQRGQIASRAARLDAILGLIDKTIASQEKGAVMEKEELLGVFGDFDPGDYQDEVRERWGATGAYKESTRRTRRYTREDWERFKTQSAEINAEIAGLMDEGALPDDPRAMAVVERHRLLINTWFYPCSRETHLGLGQMYVTDARFEATYEKIRQGMAQYVCDAIAANAAHNEPSGGEASGP